VITQLQIAPTICKLLCVDIPDSMSHTSIA
jgi:hypothetical protein